MSRQSRTRSLRGPTCTENDGPTGSMFGALARAASYSGITIDVGIPDADLEPCETIHRLTEAAAARERRELGDQMHESNGVSIHAQQGATVTGTAGAALGAAACSATVAASGAGGVGSNSFRRAALLMTSFALRPTAYCSEYVVLWTNAMPRPVKKPRGSRGFQ